MKRAALPLAAVLALAASACDRPHPAEVSAGLEPTAASFSSGSDAGYTGTIGTAGLATYSVLNLSQPGNHSQLRFASGNLASFQGGSMTNHGKTYALRFRYWIGWNSSGTIHTCLTELCSFPWTAVNVDLGYRLETLTIAGPDTVPFSGVNRWTAATEGASGYSYQWAFSLDGSSWQNVGTGSFYDRSITGGDPSFWLRVTVTRDGKSHSFQRLVTVPAVLYPPLVVVVDGPSFVETSGPYTWWADVSGGTGVYSYQWYIMWDNDLHGSGWHSLGTSSTQQRSVTAEDGNFFLKVVVNSVDQERYNVRSVTNLMTCGGDFC